jgi:hypothetical protein
MFCKLPPFTLSHAFLSHRAGVVLRRVHFSEPASLGGVRGVRNSKARQCCLSWLESWP